MLNNEKEFKYLLDKNTFGKIIESHKYSKVGIIQWYVEEEMDIRYRLTLKKLPTGFFQEWTITEKSNTNDKTVRKENERSVSPEEISKKFYYFETFKTIAKVRYIFNDDPEIIIDEFLTPFENINNKPLIDYLMEIEEKEIVKNDNFDNYLESNNYPLNNLVKIIDSYEDFKNKNLAKIIEWQEYNSKSKNTKSIFDLINFVKNKLKGNITLVMTQGISIKNQGEFKSQYESIVSKFKESKFDQIKSLDISPDICAEIDTYNLLLKNGYNIKNLYLLTPGPFLSKDNSCLETNHPYFQSDISFVGALLKCIFEKKYGLNVKTYPIESSSSQYLFENTWDILDEILKNKAKDEVIVDVTGGYKNLGLVTAIYSMFKNIPFYYKYQEGNIEEFPAFGLDWDYDYFDRIYSIINALEFNNEDKNNLDISQYLTLNYDISALFIYDPEKKGLKPFYPLNRILNDYEDKREIPFGFGENLLSIFDIKDNEKSQDNQLINMKNYIEYMIKTKWSKQWIGDLIPETVEHSQRHSKRLMDFTASLINIIGEDNFLPEEIKDKYYSDTNITYKYIYYFILIVSINIHDLGHTYSKYRLKDGNYIYLDNFPSMIRDLHNELTVQLIEEEQNNKNMFGILETNKKNDKIRYDLDNIFGNNKKEIIEAIKLVCKYHRGYLPIDNTDKGHNSQKLFVETFKIDTIPLEALLYSTHSPINDDLLKKVIIHAARWLKFIDGTDVQADRIITDAHHRARLNRTKFEALTLIDKYKNNYCNAVFLQELQKLKNEIELIDVESLTSENLEKQKELYIKIESICKNLESEVYNFVKAKLLKPEIEYNINSSEMELLDTIAFKASQFTHFEKHRSVAAIYPTWLEWDNQNMFDIKLHLKIIKNKMNNANFEIHEKVIEDIKNDINKELEGANISFGGKKLKLIFDEDEGQNDKTIL